ncbi:hypothetical protein OH77DRAFT_1440794, partial [Trametes cingulata]
SLTAAEKKKMHVQSIRDGIAKERDTTGPATGTKRPARTSAEKSKSKKTRLAVDAFTADYRKTTICEKAAKTPSRDQVDSGDDDDASVTSEGFNLAFDVDDADMRPSSRPARPLHDTTPHGARSSSRASPELDFAYAGSGAAHRDRAGWGDDDDHLDMVETPQRRKHTSSHNALVTVVRGAVIEGDNVKKMPKKQRATKAQVPPSSSRGILGLPIWVQGTVAQKIVPSTIKHYGAHDTTPWDLDHASGKHFLRTLKAVLDSVHPGKLKNDDWTPAHKIYKYSLTVLQVRQKVYDWRKGFQTQAIKIVAEHAKERLEAEGGGRDAVRRWVDDALAPGGEATYAQPNTQVPSQARGVLQSDYIVKLLSYHLKATEGAILREGYPVNAFALATVALRRAFKMFKTGVFQDLTEEFGEETVGQSTVIAKEGSVANLFLENAWSHVPETSSVGIGSLMGDERRADGEAELRHTPLGTSARFEYESAADRNTCTQCKRVLTVRELARSQGFPDWFVFHAIDDNVKT